MGKKPAGYLVHGQAKRSWWDGSAITWCGMKFKSGQHDGLWFASLTCPECKRIEREAKR